MHVKKQQLEPYMQQLTGSQWVKEVKVHKAIYCPHVYLTYMKNTSHEMAAWMNYKLLESRLPGEISITSGMQMILL